METTMDLPVEAPAPTKQRKKRSDEGQMLVRKISRMRKNRDRLKRLADDAQKRFKKADDALAQIAAAVTMTTPTESDSNE